MVFSEMGWTGVWTFQWTYSYISRLAQSGPEFSRISCRNTRRWLTVVVSSLLFGSVLQQVCTVELFMSRSGLGGKWREECCRGQEEGGGCWDRGRGPLFRNSAGLEYQWSLLMSTQCQIQGFCSVSPPVPVTAPPSWTKPKWRSYLDQHMLTNGYFFIRRRRERGREREDTESIFCLKTQTLHSGPAEDEGDVSTWAPLEPHSTTTLQTPIFLQSQK